jgi:hypothetical protein
MPHDCTRYILLQNQITELSLNFPLRNLRPSRSVSSTLKATFIKLHFSVKILTFKHNAQYSTSVFSSCHLSDESF